jgi:integrase
MGFVERRAQGKWRARYRGPDGRERSRTLGRRIDAERWLRGQETAVSAGAWTDPGRGAITIDQWIDAWLPTRRADLRATSWERVASICDGHIRRRWGSRQLASISNAEVRAWSASLLDGGLAPRTARKVIMVFRSLLAAAVADRRIQANPADSVPLPADHGEERDWMTQEQAHELLSVLPAEHRIVVLLGYFAGLRWGELSALRRRDIDVLRSRVTVARSAVQVGGRVEFGLPKTRAGARTLPLARTIMQQISTHLDERVGSDGDALVVASRTGGPVLRQNWIRRVWRPALAAAGLPGALTPHSMRHGYASWLVQAGFSVKEVSVWAGHSSIDVTLRVYSHIAELRGDDAAERLDAALTPAPVQTAGSVSQLRAN